MSDQSQFETASSKNAKTGNAKQKAFIASLVAAVVVVGLSVALISTAWSHYGEVQAEISVAEDSVYAANSNVTTANTYYENASSAYWSWYSCYIETSWLYDWICGNEAILSLDLDYAQSFLDGAKAELEIAQTQLEEANADLDVAADKFNQTSWTWGAFSVAALGALLLTSFLAFQNKRKQNKEEEFAARPDWDCPECSTHNEGGMFCVTCGFSKAEAKLTRPVHEDDSNIESEA